jgi:hypothetical protein
MITLNYIIFQIIIDVKVLVSVSRPNLYLYSCFIGHNICLNLKLKEMLITRAWRGIEASRDN